MDNTYNLLVVRNALEQPFYWSVGFLGSKCNIASFTWQARVADKLIKWFTHASTTLEYAYPKHVNVKATRNFFKLLCLIVYSFGIMFLTNKTVRVRFQVWSLK